MRIYRLNIKKPDWFYSPPTNRQIKVLKFFGHESFEHINKGRASGIINKIFSTKGNKELWEKYVYFTGDNSGESSHLRPFELEELRKISIPTDWRPQNSSESSRNKKERLLLLISDLLKEGSPFDDPVPDISFNGTNFVFTGKFVSGERKECFATIEKLGAIGNPTVTNKTDYLVIGNEGSEYWAEGTHGRKIQKAMMIRLEKKSISIISESDWIEAVKKSNKLDEE